VDIWLSSEAAGVVRERMELHHDELDANWHRVVGHEKPLVIDRLP
jgi:hypothetical protein